MVTQDDIRAGLKALGVGPGDLLLAHTSLSSFGHVEGGANAVIDAMLEAVGPQGTVVVPTLSFTILKEKPLRFSVKDTPSSTGLVTEVFRKRPQAVRSIHPTSSAAAIGPHAAYLTRNHLDTPCGPASPYARLAELGGKVVFFGAPLSTNSLFHCAEDIVRPDYLGYSPVPDVEVALPDGGTLTVTVRRYDCADRGVRRRLGNMEPVFRREGLLRETFIGNSRTVLIDARANVESCARVLREHPQYILTELRTG